MTEPLVAVERRPDGVAVVTLQRPKVNALSIALLSELEAAALELTAEPPGAVVVTGGARFSAGADIAELGGRPEWEAVGRAFRAALDAAAAIPRFTIAAIERIALGGGCELALACDWRIAADDAELGQPEVLLGIIPGGGGTQRLPRLIGRARAKELLLSGRQVGAAEALRIGLVEEVVPAGTTLAAAIDKAAAFARGAVLAHGLVKEAVDGGLDHPLAWGLDGELACFGEVFDTEDSRIGVRSFLESGPGAATFQGR